MADQVKFVKLKDEWSEPVGICEKCGGVLRKHPSGIVQCDTCHAIIFEEDENESNMRT